MIRNVRRKFMILAMVASIVMSTILVAGINITNFYLVNKDIDSILNRIADNDGTFPIKDMMKDENDSGMQPKPLGGKEHFSIEKQLETRFFTVNLYDDGTSMASLKSIASITKSDAVAMARQALESGKNAGFQKEYKFLITRKDNYYLVVMVNAETKIDAMIALMWTSIGIELIGIVLIFLFLALTSRRIVRPVIESNEKQKQFITDASHELKTPLTVIATNMDILSMDLGENEWVNGTRKQVVQLKKLVNSLVSLSRLEEENVPLISERFNVSNAVMEAAEPFQGMAEFMGKHMSCQVEDEIYIKGDEGAIRQLVGILCDNAVKYSSMQGDIQVSFKKSGKKAVLEVSNLCNETVPEETLQRLFNRFYRADTSRSKENGKSSFGIGLALAKAIVERHGGKIVVKQDKEKRIQFRVTFNIDERKGRNEI